MSKKLMSITVQGNVHKYSFQFYGDPIYLNFWRLEGLDVELVENTVPDYIASIGLTKIWCKMQDVINFKFWR